MFCCIVHSVVFQSADERNYHIFYQLCTAADDKEFLDFQLGMEITSGMQYNIQGAPITNNPLGKILYLCNYSRFFHQNYRIYR